MVGRGLKSDNKTLPRYDKEFNLSETHPCTYQFIASGESSEQGNPLFEIVVHAEKNEISYGQAVEECKTATQETGRKDDDIPVIDGSSATLVDRLMDLDELARGGGSGTRVPKKKISNVWLSAKNTYQNEKYRYVCASLAPLFVGHKPTVTQNEVNSLSEENRKRIADAVGVPRSELGVEDPDTEEDEKEEIDLLEDKKTENSSDSKYVQTRDVWGSDEEFVTWLYAKMVGRDNIADRISNQNPILNNSLNREFQDLAERSSTATSLSRNIKTNDNIDFTTDQEKKWSIIQEIEQSEETQQEALVEILQEMIDEILEINYDGESLDDEDIRMVEPEDEDLEWSDEDVDPTDPSSLKSVLMAKDS